MHGFVTLGQTTASVFLRVLDRVPYLLERVLQYGPLGCIGNIRVYKA